MSVLRLFTVLTVCGIAFIIDNSVVIADNHTPPPSVPSTFPGGGDFSGGKNNNNNGNGVLTSGSATDTSQSATTGNNNNVNVNLGTTTSTGSGNGGDGEVEIDNNSNGNEVSQNNNNVNANVNLPWRDGDDVEIIIENTFATANVVNQYNFDTNINSATVTLPSGLLPFPDPPTNATIAATAAAALPSGILPVPDPPTITTEAAADAASTGPNGLLSSDSTASSGITPTVAVPASTGSSDVLSSSNSTSSSGSDDNNNNNDPSSSSDSESSSSEDGTGGGSFTLKIDNRCSTCNNINQYNINYKTENVAATPLPGGLRGSAGLLSNNANPLP